MYLQVQEGTCRSFGSRGPEFQYNPSTKKKNVFFFGNIPPSFPSLLPPFLFPSELQSSSFVYGSRKERGKRAERCLSTALYMSACIGRLFLFFAPLASSSSFPESFSLSERRRRRRKKKTTGHLESSKYGKRGVGLYFWWAWPCSSYGVTCQAEIPPSSQRGDEQHARTPEIHRQYKH